MVNNFIPGQHIGEALQPNNFTDFVDLTSLFYPPIKNKSGVISKLGELLYHVFGFEDYRLVITHYVETFRGLVKLIAHLHPLDQVGKEFPGERPGFADDLQNQLAFYFYDLFWPSAQQVLENYENVYEFSWPSKLDGFNLIPPEELSHNMESLEHTVNGFQILRLGTAHSSCARLSPQDCVQKARKEFEEALESDADNAFASFGFGVVLLRQAVDANKANAAAYTIGQLLVGAGYHIYRARKLSKFLLNLTESQEWHTILQKWPQYKDLSITNNFIDTIHYYYVRASEEFAKANYADAIDLVTKVRDIPPDFIGLLRSFEYEARLYNTKDRSEAHLLLKEFKQLCEADDSDPGWRQSYAYQACRHHYESENAVNLLEEAINDSRDLCSYYLSSAMKGSCLAELGRHEEAKELAKTIAEKLRVKEFDDEEFMSVYLELGYLYAILEDYESAADYFIKAAKLWQGYRDNVRNAHDLKDFRDSKAFRRFNATILEHYH